MQVLEALALDEPIPEQVMDETMPDEEGMESIRPQVLAFRVCYLLLPAQSRQCTVIMTSTDQTPAVPDSSEL